MVDETLAIIPFETELRDVAYFKNLFRGFRGYESPDSDLFRMIEHVPCKFRTSRELFGIKKISPYATL